MQIPKLKILDEKNKILHKKSKPATFPVSEDIRKLCYDTIKFLELSQNEEVAKDVAMHMAAMNPIAIDKDSVPAETVEHEKHMIKEEIKNDEKNKNKPEEIIDKMAMFN